MTRLRISTTVVMAVAVFAAPLAAYAQHADHAMNDLRQAMPKLLPSRVYVVGADEDWSAKTFFGPENSMVSMMNLMMVGGSGMEGMKMAPMQTGAEMNGKPKMGEMKNKAAQSGMAAMQGVSGTAGMTKGAGPSPNGPAVVAVLSPNPPVVGDNALELTVNDNVGKPMPGLKLGATVAMTNMDMGTSRPAVKELGGGRYSVTPYFSMIGPWRVTISGDGVSTTFDFNAGGRQKWTQTGVSAGNAVAANDAMTLPAQTSPLDARDEKPDDQPSIATQGSAHSTNAGTDAIPGKDMSGSSSTNAPAAGKAAPKVAMIKAVIVKPTVGENPTTISLTDAPGKPVTGAKVTTSVAMTSMDMGTTHPTVKEVSPGHYKTTVTFSMQGPWRVTVTAVSRGARPVSKSFDFTVK